MTTRQKYTEDSVPEKEIHIVNVSSVEETLSQIDSLIEIFTSKGLLVLRGATFSVEDQLSIATAFGNILNWNVYSDANDAVVNTSTYDGGHSDRTDREYVEGPSDYVLDWHIEQVYYVHPILAGLWNMNTFTAPAGSGDTRFVDSIDLYNLYDYDDMDFLSKCVVQWNKPAPHGEGPFFTKVVDIHPISDIPLLRVETDRGSYMMPKLILWDNQEPSEDQITRLDSLLSSLKDNLNNNLEIRYSQHWEENDLLVVDLFRMYHAVMGGFKYGERKFTGIGARPRVYDTSMYNDIEKVKEK